MIEILTIGHSTLDYQSFLSSLKLAGVTAIADVRSAPFSRTFPHFNRDELRRELALASISYVFLGDELGGRPKRREYFSKGIADYEKMATSSDFNAGIQRIIEGAQKYRVALMCAERDPLDCHRCLLVGRALSERGISVQHILSPGKTTSQAEIERQLLVLANKDADDMFASPRERLADAYRTRSRQVAYGEAEPKGSATKNSVHASPSWAGS